MNFEVLTLLPEFFDTPLKQSVLGRAIDRGLIGVGVRNIRDYATDKHRNTDDTPYGGGAGMVMKVEPVVAAIEDARERLGEGKTKVILTSPQGRPLTQSLALELSKTNALVVVCGRYEGFDERIRSFVDLELSVGDYILSGGEVAALVVIDSVSRLIPGVLGGEGSLDDESFSSDTGGLLEYPQYTRPEVFRDMKVPEVLLGGNHSKIEGWRRRKSIERTLERRPELLKSADLNKEDRELLKEVKKEAGKL